MTKTVGTISRGGFCKSCGKELPQATRRRQFCDDTCRQAAHRVQTPTKAVKAAIPARAKLGQPKTAGDKDWLLHELRLLRTAFSQKCVGGVIEVYHHRYGRGVLDLYRPFVDCRIDPYPDAGPVARVLGGLPKPRKNLAVWRQACCLFNKPKLWHYLDWKETWLLAWHEENNMPKHLRWVHKDRRYRVRRRRVLNFDFQQTVFGYDPQKDCYVAYRSHGGDHSILSELTEDTGKHHDNIEKLTPIPLDDSDSTDTNRTRD